MQSQVLSTKKLNQFLSGDPYSFNEVGDSDDSGNETNSLTNNSSSNSSISSGIYNFGLKKFLKNPFAT
jgi:hypothetical protein